MSLLMPIPKRVKRRPLPKLDVLKEEIARLRDLNQLRNEAIQIRRDLVALATVAAKASHGTQTNTTKDDFVMRLSWPDTVLQEVVNTLGRIETYLSMEAEENTEAAEEAAEKPIALLDRLNELFEDEFARNGGPQPLLMAMVQYAARDGMIAQKLCRRPNDPDNVWDYELFDPIEAIPVFIGGKYVRCYRISLMKVQDIRAQWGDNLLPDAKGDDEREVIACYDDYYHAVFTTDDDENWLKPPKPHEYEWGIPIQITYFRGYTGSRGDRVLHNADEDVEANRGRGIFDAVVDELKEWARTQSAVIDRMMLTVRPPIVVTSEQGEAADVKVNRSANGRTNLRGGEKVEPLAQSNLDTQYIQILSQTIVGALENATLPLPSMARFQSGFERHVAEKQAASFYEPFLRGLKIALRWRYRAALLCFRQFGEQMDVSGLSARGKPFRWVATPDMIPEDPRVVVEFSDINPLDRIQMLGAIAPIYSAGGIDSLTAFGPDFLKLKNPHLIMERIREEQIWKNPAAQAALLPSVTIGALEKMLKDARNRGHDLQAKVIEEQLVKLGSQILAPQPQMPPGVPPMGPGEPPQPPMPMPQMPGMGAPPPALPMANPAAAPSDFSQGGAGQLGPDILAQRENGRAPIGGA